MSLTAKDVEEILRLLEESQFDRLNLEIDGIKLELARDGARPKSERPAKAPERRLINIDDVGALASFLVSDGAQAITGDNIHIDSGYHVVD